jgi:hypothetical protein
MIDYRLSRLLKVNNGIMLCGANKSTQKKKLKLGDYALWFQKFRKNTYWEIYQKVVWPIYSIYIFYQLTLCF